MNWWLFVSLPFLNKKLYPFDTPLHWSSKKSHYLLHKYKSSINRCNTNLCYYSFLVIAHLDLLQRISRYWCKIHRNSGCDRTRSGSCSHTRLMICVWIYNRNICYMWRWCVVECIRISWILNDEFWLRGRF